MRYLEDIRREADDSVKKEKQKERSEVTKAVKKTQSNIERATIGDLDVFSQLKSQLAASETPPPPPPAPVKKEEKPAEPAKVEEKVEKAPEPAKAEVKEKPKAPAKKAAKADGKPDDFKKIEGIGPKINELLKNAGIPTFQQLSETPAEKIKEILAEAGSRYRMHDPTTWPAQAKMAAEGDWDGLKKWQDELDGGK